MTSNRDLFPFRPVILNDLVSTAVRSRVMKVMSSLREKGESEETILFLYPEEGHFWTLSRSWDQIQKDYFFSYKKELRVRDGDSASEDFIKDFINKLVLEISEVVIQHIVCSVRVVDALGLPSLQEIIDQDVVDRVMIS